MPALYQLTAPLPDQAGHIHERQQICMTAGYPYPFYMFNSVIFADGYSTIWHCTKIHRLLIQRFPVNLRTDTPFLKTVCMLHL